jgi:hypothetical protein
VHEPFERDVAGQVFAMNVDSDSMTKFLQPSRVEASRRRIADHQEG